VATLGLYLLASELNNVKITGWVICFLFVLCVRYNNNNNSKDFSQSG